MQQRVYISKVAELVGRSQFAVRDAEASGRIPVARRNYRDWRYWLPEDLPRIYKAFDVEPPSSTLDGLIAALENIAPDIQREVEKALAGRDPEQVMRQALTVLEK